MTTSWGVSLPDPTNITLLEGGERSSRPSTACCIPTGATPSGFNEWNTQLRWISSARSPQGTDQQQRPIIFAVRQSLGLTVLPIRGSLSSDMVGGASSGAYHTALRYA